MILLLGKNKGRKIHKTGGYQLALETKNAFYRFK